MTGTFWEFSLALFFFLGSHGIASAFKLRGHLISLISQSGYIIFYSIFSTLLLIWLIATAINAPQILLWHFGFWTHKLTHITMIFVSILIVSALFSPNPLTILSPNASSFNPKKPPLAATIHRHPLMLAFALWSATHLLTNGTLTLAIMFGLFLIFSLIGPHLIDRRQKRQLGEKQWQNLAQNTSNIPFEKWRHITINRWDTIRIIGGVFIYIMLYHLHQPVIGVTPIWGF